MKKIIVLVLIIIALFFVYQIISAYLLTQAAPGMMDGLEHMTRDILAASK